MMLCVNQRWERENKSIFFGGGESEAMRSLEIDCQSRNILTTFTGHMHNRAYLDAYV